MLNFKCKNCNHIFTDEELPRSPSIEIKSNKIKRENESYVDYLYDFIEEVTKKTRCPKCNSTVYLTDKNFIKEFDFTSEPLVRLIKDTIDLVKSDRKKDISKEYMEYAKEIVSELMWSPGRLILFEDPDLMKEAESAIAVIWDNVDEKELWDEAFHNSLIVNIVGDYFERAKKLKPTLVSVKPDNQTSIYFQDAMHSWLFGLDSATLILCCSIIEKLLKQKLSRKPNLVWKSIGSRLKDRDLSELINNAANEGLLDKSTKKMAHGIRLLRRDAVHQLKPISSDEAYNAIMDTRKIIEQLLKL